MSRREILLPEVTDEAGRRFLDIVPIVRKMRAQIVSKQTIRGEEVRVPCADREIPVLLYRAEGTKKPAIFHFHGGGFAFGSAAADDAYCAELCRRSGCPILNVQYRLTPEARFPAQLEDIRETIDYFRAHADAYGIDPERIGVTGFSAGANLATAVALKLAGEGKDWLKAQVLHYPMLDQKKNSALRPDAPEKNTYIDPVMVEGFLRFYSEPDERDLPFVSPGYAPKDLLHKMAPCLIIAAEDDILCRESEEYRDRIQAAAGDVTLKIMPGVHHCYIEDAFNRDLFEALTLEPKKRALDPAFPEKAEQALQMAAEYFRRAFCPTGENDPRDPFPEKTREPEDSAKGEKNNMSSVLDPIYDKAKQNPQRVIFPEGDNEKMMQAAFECGRDGYIKPLLLGDAEALKKLAEERGYDTSVFTFIDMNDEEFKQKVIAGYLAQSDMLSEKGLNRRAQKPLHYAMIIEAAGEADVTFAGIDYTTRDVLLAAQEVIGLKPNISTVSSIGLCNIPGFAGSEGELLAIGDSAVCTNPDPERLADIAISACETVQELMGWEPRCAMVSYSTLGSGMGSLIDKVTEALKIAQEKRPDLNIDGEFQLDAAIVPEVAAKKVTRESKVAGKANVVIWPDLNVGNIAVKLIQQFGHADAYGPLLQGYNKIVCDCSRGAPVSELKGNIVMSAVRAGNMKK